MKIGILTSGGDCPGLNAVIRGVVLKGATAHDLEFVGFRDGWRGVVDGDFFPLDAPRGAAASRSRAAPSSARAAPTPSRARAAAPRTSQTHARRATASTRSSRSAARAPSPRPDRLTDDGINVVGVPKTIDNDLARHRLLVRLRHGRRDRDRGDRPAAHDRASRTAAAWSSRSWAATSAGSPCTRAWPAARTRSSSPSSRQSIDQICDLGRVGAATAAARRSWSSPRASTSPTWRRRTRDKGLDAFNRPRLGGIAERLAPMIEERTGIETRATVLGHIQRGGAPVGVRPRARHAPRHGRDRRGLREGVGLDGHAPRHRHQDGLDRRGRRHAQRGARSPLRRGQRSSSADPSACRSCNR